MKSNFDEDTAIRCGRDKNTSADVLKTIVGHSDKVNRLVAKHPNADGKILDELSGSKDKATRRNVFLNPATRLENIHMLIPEFPKELIKLPTWVIDDLIEEHSQIILGIRQPHLFRILMNPKCPQKMLNWACKRGGLYEQLAVWKNPCAPVDLLTEMMVTGYQQEANVLLVLPEKILEFLNGLGFVGAPPRNYEELCDYGSWLGNTSRKVDDLWKKLVPEEGEAETVQGEMVRAIGRIQGDYYSNGFGNWHQCYGLSQFLVVHLADESTFTPFTVSVLRADIRALDSCGQRCMYGGNLERTFLDSINDMEEIFPRLDAAIVVWCERHPELIPYKQAN